MYDAASDAKKTKVAAISSGSAHRPSGIRASVLRGQLLVGADVLGHRRRRQRSDRVHGDLLLRQLPGQRLREADDGGLGRAVVDLADGAHQPGGRGDVDDAAGAVHGQEWQRGLADGERASDMDVENELELLGRHLREHRRRDHPGVVHHDVKGAPGQFGGLLGRPGRLPGVAHVEHRGLGPAAGGHDLGGRRGRRVLVHVGHQHGRAGRGQRPGDRPADALAGAGHERGAPGK